MSNALPDNVQYRSRILDYGRNGEPHWHAAATVQGFHGYGYGTSEEEARSNASKDLLRKLHGGWTER